MRLIQHYRTSARRWMPVFVMICCGLFINEKSFAIESVPSVANLSVVTLKAKYTELGEQLLNNQFKRALYLNSEESSHDLKGEIYAVVDYPFTTFNSAFNSPAQWCDAFILNINIKYCHSTSKQDGDGLMLNIGKKYSQPLADTYRVEFKYREMVTTPGYFTAELNAKNGPLSTYDYRILIEAIPLKDGHTFMHFTYAYSFGLTGRLAMQTYLITTGKDKIGFTVTGNQSDGQPEYIKGIRGVVERNTMRYYLAIDAYLAALASPAENQFEKSLQYWYTSSDQYARQLHEVERNEYLLMKRSEYLRQQIVQ